MIKFDNFFCLLEGGNLSIDNKYFADEIKLQYLNQQKALKFVEDFENLLRDINKVYKEMNNEFLWPQIETLLKTNKMYAGSSRIFFEFVKEGKFDLFFQYKKELGDFDIQFCDEHATKLREVFYNPNSPLSNERAPKQIGKFVFIGEGGTGAIQLNTLFAYNFGFDMKTGAPRPDAQTYVQIDFEPVEFERGIPTKFSQFAHSADFNDIQNSIKGVFHKFMIQSILDASNQFVADIKLYTLKGKGTTRKNTKLSVYSFSVDRGFRERYVPALTEINGKEILKNNEDKLVYFDVKNEEKPLLKSKGYVQLDPSKGPDKIELKRDLVGISVQDINNIPISVPSLDYNQDLDVLFQLMFGVEPTEANREQFNSYTGLLDLLQEYKGNLDSHNKDYIDTIYRTFVEKLYGPQAQLLYKRDVKNPKPKIMDKDFLTKQAPIHKFQQYFPDVTSNFTKEQFDSLIKTYYTIH